MDITDDDSPRSSSPQLEDEKRGLLASTLTTTVRSDNDDPCSIRESKKLIVRLYRAVALLSVLCFILLISSIVLAIQKQALEPKTHPSWLPPETRIKKIFEFRSLYGGEPTEQSEDAWRELIPKGKGYVIISNDTAIPEMPSLDQSVEEQHAMVSVFHQLHCLYMTKEAYYQLLRGDNESTRIGHLAHCWELIRQGIMCHGDTSLEWLQKPPNDQGVSAWGMQHECRDYDAIFAWAEENRLTERQIINE